MRFWDTSALAALLLQEESSDRLSALLERDEEIAAWWLTETECWSSIARARRNARIDQDTQDMCAALLSQLRDAWLEIVPSDEIKMQARRLLLTHRLRAADAIQLAAAIVWSSRYDGVEFVTLDGDLRDAARIEGFAVV